MGTDSYRGTPDLISQGDTPDFFSANFAATKRKGVPIEATKATWDGKFGESEAYFVSVTNGGAAAQTGRLLEIDGDPTSDLHITIDTAWRGYMDVLGLNAGNARVQFQSLVVDDSAKLFPEQGNSSILAREEYVDEQHKGPYNNNWVGSKTTTHTISSGDLYDGRVLRVSAACTTIAEVSLSLGEAQADAFNEGSNSDNSDAADNWEGHVFWGAIQVDWS